MAIKYTGDKYKSDAKIFRVGVDKETPSSLLSSGVVGFIPSNLTPQYEPWQSPSSDGSGERYFKKYDKTDDTDYLYDATINTRKTTESERRETGFLNQKRGRYAGMDYVQETTYKKVGPAPGGNPPGTRQPDRAKKRGKTGNEGKGGNYATSRSRAGARGTILTGSRGLVANNTNNTKTLLGG